MTTLFKNDVRASFKLKRYLKSVLLVQVTIFSACNTSSNFDGEATKAGRSTKPQPASSDQAGEDAKSEPPISKPEPKPPTTPSGTDGSQSQPPENAIATIRAALDNLRWNLPCQGPIDGSGLCRGERTVRDLKVLEGDAAVTYNIRLRFRGVVELKPYLGGQNDGGFLQIGGSPSGDLWNVYRLDISSPPQTYYLNRGLANKFEVSKIDFEKEVTATGGATFTLSADTRDGVQMSNSAQITIPQVEAGVYNGQFIQMNVVDIK